MKAIISPSILSADLKKLGAQVREAQQGGADQIHVDVMDGRFVPNITFGPEIVRACRDASDLPVDVHLMIVEPERHLKNFIEAGASTVTIHYETYPHIHRSLQSIREMGARAGLTYNPGTPLESLRYLAEVVDQVLIMSVNPGFGGQEYLPFSLEKIRTVRSILDEFNSQATIQVDGGISADTILENWQAGARNFVAGTAIFKHPDGIAAGIAALRAALD
ncbi:MAG: ribulose-phosphate 3-epimerase [Anaerolineaceae bacterium]|nr:ribulose-phosphate 3-epimerase [Anaerolineaceae bacterium]